MQIVGKRWHEMELLAFAQEIDTVIGGFQSPSAYLQRREDPLYNDERQASKGCEALP